MCDKNKNSKKHSKTMTKNPINPRTPRNKIHSIGISQVYQIKIIWFLAQKNYLKNF